jgi:WD40 repeat protein
MFSSLLFKKFAGLLKSGLVDRHSPSAMGHTLARRIRHLLRVLAPAVGLALAVGPAYSAEPPASTQPFLAIEAGMHTAPIWRIAVDAAGRYAVTASADKTARVWDVASGKLLSVLRVPVGGAIEGQLYAAALSPDASLVALGGWTGPEVGTNNIYLFDRASGRMLARIGGLPRAIIDLAFSPDGSHLAAALEGNHGIRIFAGRTSWKEVARDTAYNGSTQSVDFDGRGRLVTTSHDGKLRLYNRDFRLIAVHEVAGGKRPFFARFSPDSRQIAVGFEDTSAINVLNASTLALAYVPNTGGVENGNLRTVAWSADGRFLYAAGQWTVNREHRMRRWSEGGKGTFIDRRVAHDSVTDLVPLPDGRLVFAAADPAWGVLSAEGGTLSRQNSPVVDFHRSPDSLRMTANGKQVRFAYEQGGKSPAVFDLASTSLGLDRAGFTQPRITAPGVTIENWQHTNHATLNGQRVVLEPFEVSRSLAIAREGTRFALGTDWFVRLYDRSGRLLWRVPTSGAAWSVNVSDDGRWVVAAYGDGTIRWHRVSDGREVLALFPHADRKRWITWTPEGFFASSPGAVELIGYRLNRGRDQAGQFVAATQLLERFYRPDLIARRLDPEGDALIAQALRQVGDVRAFLARRPAAPSVEVLSAPEAHSAGEYELKVRVKDEGGGVGRLVVQVDGVEVEGRSEGSAASDTTVSRKFLLAPGRRVITVTAVNREGMLSKPEVITVDVARPEPPALHMLAVGIGRYRDPALNLRFAASDAARIRSHFELHGGKLYRSVQVRGLQDEQATRANIEREMLEVAKRAKPEDVFVLYMSGHGVSLDGNYYFIPSDAVSTSTEVLLTRSLDQNALNALLSKIPAAKILVLLDSCSSAARVSGVPERHLIQHQAIDRFSRLTGRAFIAAVTNAQMAVEGEGENGVFTYVVLEALRGAADRNANGVIDVDELANYVEQRMPVVTKQKWGYEQFPLSNIQGASFAILSTPGR